MPNWCSNTLTIHGEPMEVHRFLSYSKGKELGCDEKYRPGAKTTPIALRKFVKPRHKPDDWYWWQVNNWGSKWHPSFEPPLIRDNGQTAVFAFSSAWSPIVPAVVAMGAKFPDLRFSLEYEEPGMCFYGTLTVDGEDVTDECLEMTEETHPEYFDDNA